MLDPTTGEVRPEGPSMKPGAIIPAMLAVMAEFGPMAPEMHEGKIRYPYIRIADILARLQPLLVRHGVVVLPWVREVRDVEYQAAGGTRMRDVTATVSYRFLAADGSYVEASAIGEAADSGDKASPKAMTAAFKAALRQVLAIAEHDDTEADDDDAKARAGVTAPRPVAPAPRPVAPEPRPVGTRNASAPARTGIIYPFGRDKGKDLADCQSESLRWVTSPGSPWGPDCGDDPKYGDRNARSRSAALSVLRSRGIAVNSDSAVGPPEHDPEMDIDPEEIPF